MFELITYLTQFQVNEKLDKKTFVELVIEWKQGSGYDVFDELLWDGETFSTIWEEKDKKLSLDELAEKGIIAMQFRKEDEYGMWITDLIFNYLEGYVTVRVALERTEFTTDFYPTPCPPLFVKNLINGGYTGKDDGLPITQKAYSLDDYSEVMKKISEKKAKYTMPIVLVSKKDDGNFPIELDKLSFELQGVAHVLYDGDGIRISDYKNYFGCESRNGMVFIVYPNINMKRTTINLFGSSNDNPEYIISRVKTGVYNYSNQEMKRDVDTWSGIQNEKLYEQNKQLISTQKALKDENDELINIFGEQLKKMEDANAKLNNTVQKLEVENQALRTKLASKDNVPLIYMGEEHEFYEGEIREIVLEILERSKKNLQPDTRREHIISDILENNDYNHVQAGRREEIKKMLRDYKNLNTSLRNNIEKFGFIITEDGSHYRWSYFGDNRYVTTVSKTGSDSRTGKNMAAVIDKSML